MAHSSFFTILSETCQPLNHASNVNGATSSPPSAQVLKSLNSGTSGVIVDEITKLRTDKEGRWEYSILLGCCFFRHEHRFSNWLGIFFFALISIIVSFSALLPWLASNVIHYILPWIIWNQPGPSELDRSLLLCSTVHSNCGLLNLTLLIEIYASSDEKTIRTPVLSNRSTFITCNIESNTQSEYLLSPCTC